MSDSQFDPGPAGVVDPNKSVIDEARALGRAMEVQRQMRLEHKHGTRLGSSVGCGDFGLASPFEGSPPLQAMMFPPRL